MGRYVDKDSWEEEILIPDTHTPILGGQPVWEGDRLIDGFANVSAAVLADRTRHLKNKLDGIEIGLESNFEDFMKKEDNLSGLEDIQQAKYNLGLNLVDNTRDLAKPISNATQEALDEKVDKEEGMGLSEENYTLADKDKLSGIEAEATKNSTDAQLRDRATHTGEQPISSVSGLQTGLDGKVDKTISVVAGTGLSGGGALSANRTLSVSFGTTTGTVKEGNWQPSVATKAQVLSGNSSNYVTGSSYVNTIAWNTTSHASGTVTLNLNTSLNHILDITGDVIIGTPSNSTLGKTGDIVLRVNEDVVVGWSTEWKFLGAIPNIGANGEVWVVSYKVLSATEILASANKVV